MQLIDAHHHLWIPEQTSPDIGYGWLRDIGAIKPFGDPTPIQCDYRWSEFAAESTQHQLVGSVFLQTDGALPDPVLETEWVATELSSSSIPHGIVAFVDLAASDVEEQLARHAQCGELRGVRQIVSRLDDNPTLSFAATHYLRSTLWQQNLLLLANRKLSFDLQLYPEQMREATEVFSQLPELSIIIDHTGSPWDLSKEGWQRWQHGVRAMATLPNCSIKLSGFGMFDTNWSADSIQPMIEVCLAAFGSERILFGSNFPVDKLMANYDDVVNRVADAVRTVCKKRGLHESVVMNDIFSRTAQRVYRLA